MTRVGDMRQGAGDRLEGEGRRQRREQTDMREEEGKGEMGKESRADSLRVGGKRLQEEEAIWK